MSFKHPRGAPVSERLAHYSAINPTTGCHEWSGCKSQNGYAYIRVAGRTVYAHRVAWELANGPVPAGRYLDHLCRNRRCINPGHLEPVTHRENVIRGIGPTAINAAKTHCYAGHELSPDNLTSRELRLGHRKCLTCKRERNRADKKAKRQALACAEVAQP